MLRWNCSSKVLTLRHRDIRYGTSLYIATVAEGFGAEENNKDPTVTDKL